MAHKCPICDDPCLCQGDTSDEEHGRFSREENACTHCDDVAGEDDEFDDDEDRYPDDDWDYEDDWEDDDPY